jgi:hypothetical protein
MANAYGYENLLTPDEVSKTVNIIDSLSDKWVRRGPDNSRHSFYTIGGVAHLDILEGEEITQDKIDFFNTNNKILSDNFKYLYDIIIKKVNEIFGPCEMIDDVPFPGFYIFGDIDSDGKESPSPYGDVGAGATVHRDGLFPHLDYKWNQLGGATDSFAITLAIELPKSGGGVMIWDQPDIGVYSDSEYAKYCKSLDFTKVEHNINAMENHISNPIPEVIEYKPGGIFWHHCGIYHAIGYSANTLTTDRRITMQIFGVKCNDIWRLIF